MGTPIGYFSDDIQNDYPELNKCPDCETYFQTDNCPLCGKECPEEMRAGHRKAVKKKKPKKGRRNNGRVQFVPWYMNAWFIIALLIIFPIVGLILLWQSDCAKGWKIAGTILTIVLYFAGGLLGLLSGLFAQWFGGLNEDAISQMTQAEYAEVCEAVDLETLYRYPDEYAEMDVRLDLIVDKVHTVESSAGIQTYYTCRAEVNGRTLYFTIADHLSQTTNLLQEDRITVWGRVVIPKVAIREYPTVNMYFVSVNS